MTLDDVVDALNFFLAVVNLCVASVLVLTGFSVNRQIGGATVTADAQEAYQKLLDSRGDVKTLDQADRFYDRFWAAQILQYEQWRARLIPDLIYADWLLKRRDQYIANSTILNIGFSDAWQLRYEERYKHTRFGKFMDRVFRSGPRHPTSARAALRHIEGEMWRARLGF